MSERNLAFICTTGKIRALSDYTNAYASFLTNLNRFLATAVTTGGSGSINAESVRNIRAIIVRLNSSLRAELNGYLDRLDCDLCCNAAAVSIASIYAAYYNEILAFLIANYIAAINVGGIGTGTPITFDIAAFEAYLRTAFNVHEDEIEQIIELANENCS